MSPKEKLDKIKSFLGFSADQPTEQKFLETTLQDGTPIRIEGETIAEGAGVTLQDGTPAPDGEHTLSDGTVISISAGKISAIKPVEGNDLASEVAKLKEKHTQVLSQLADHKKKMEELEAKVKQDQKAFAAHKEGIHQLIVLVGEMAKDPEVKPAEKKKSSFAQEKSKKDEKLMQIAENLKTIKNHN